MIELHPGGPAGVEVAAGDEWMTATSDGSVVGHVGWKVERGLVTVGRIAGTTGSHRDPELLAAARAHAAEAGRTAMTVQVGDDQTELLTVLQDATVLSRFMVKPAPAGAPTLPEGFDVRDMTADEFEAWRSTSVEEYARDDLARSGGDLELALQRARDSYDRFLPDGPATVDTRLLTLTQDGEPVGDLWLRHHWPRHRDPEPGSDQTFTFDVAVHLDRRGQGLGRAAMLAAECEAVRVGDRQLGLNVFGANDTAYGLYRSLGYTARSTVFAVDLG
ncbi:N-acetyltransferase family protein [Jatrophihabitans sp. YIM 134969]